MSHQAHRAEAGRDAVDVHILVVSSTRTLDTDTGGLRIAERLVAAGHRAASRQVVDDDVGAIRAAVRVLADADAGAVILTGGTGISGRDVTPEALAPLLAPRLDGFGEQFRALSFAEIGPAAMLSRACAGLVGRTVVFAVPGSSAAGTLAVDALIGPELAHLVHLARSDRPGPSAVGQEALAAAEDAEFEVVDAAEPPPPAVPGFSSGGPTPGRAGVGLAQHGAGEAAPALEGDAPWRREHAPQREIKAPARCDRLRRVDDRRVVAFGPACGLYVSQDLGGLWRAMSTHLDDSRPDAVPGRGTGGFVDRDTAWRLDGGLWWTHDGGARWALVPSARGRSLAWGVFVDRRRGVFVQRDGWVVATDDGGVRWRLVLRGDVSRLVTAGRTVMLTTSDRALLSLDGGGAWRRVATLPSGRELDPALAVDGERRHLDPGPRLRLVQQRDAIELLRRGGTGAEREPLVRALPRGWVMLAAHTTGAEVDRVLLSGGAVLHRRAELAAR